MYKVSFGVSAVRDNTSNSSRVHCMFYQGPLNPLDTPKCQILHLLCSPPCPSQCCLCQLIIGPSCLLFDFLWTRLCCSLPLVHLFDMTLLFLVSVFSQCILPRCMSGQSLYSFSLLNLPCCLSSVCVIFLSWLFRSLRTADFGSLFWTKSWQFCAVWIVTAWTGSFRSCPQFPSVAVFCSLRWICRGTLFVPVMPLVLCGTWRRLSFWDGACVGPCGTFWQQL